MLRGVFVGRIMGSKPRSWRILAGQRDIIGTKSMLFSSSAEAATFEEESMEDTNLGDVKVEVHSRKKAGGYRMKALRERLAMDEKRVMSELGLGDESESQKQPSTALLRSFSDTNTNTTPSDPEPVVDSESSVLDLISRLRDSRAAEESDLGAGEMLVDRYKRFHNYLRISLVERCNLRCQYCMPPEGVPLQPETNLLSKDEIQRLVHLFVKAGVDKVRLTGGEPLLRKDLPEIISSISSFPSINSVGITTNGITLSKHLPALLQAGLTHVNISLDTLQPDKFTLITRRNGLPKVIESINQATRSLPPHSVKLNCVVMNNFNHQELHHFLNFTKHQPLDVRFIEWMPFNDNGWNDDRFFSYKQMLNHLTHHHHIRLQRVQDSPNDTTKWYRADNHVGRVGFITSMSEHFCSTCNRLRITADGKLKVCLFGSKEVSLRDAMRNDTVTDDDLTLLIDAAVKKKTFALGGHGDAQGIKEANNNRPMTLIGG